MQKHWGIFLGMLKKVGIFLGIKYEPLSDQTPPPPPSLKYVSGAPGDATCFSQFFRQDITNKSFLSLMLLKSDVLVQPYERTCIYF